MKPSLYLLSTAAIGITQYPILAEEYNDNWIFTSLKFLCVCYAWFIFSVVKNLNCIHNRELLTEVHYFRAFLLITA